MKTLGSSLYWRKFRNKYKFLNLRKGLDLFNYVTSHPPYLHMIVEVIAVSAYSNYGHEVGILALHLFGVIIFFKIINILQPAYESYLLFQFYQVFI